MPEGKEKVQLLQSDNTKELIVKAPGQPGVLVSRGMVRFCCANTSVCA